jgi:hypothetical protein
MLDRKNHPNSGPALAQIDGDVPASLRKPKRIRVRRLFHRVLCYRRAPAAGRGIAIVATVSATQSHANSWVDSLDCIS